MSFDVMAAMAAAMGVGAMAQPTRQPVTAKLLERGGEEWGRRVKFRGEKRFRQPVTAKLLERGVGANPSSEGDREALGERGDEMVR